MVSPGVGLHGALHEREAALLVQAERESIAGALLTADRDRARLVELGHNGWRFVRQYEPTEVAAALLEELRDVLRQRTGNG